METTCYEDIPKTTQTTVDILLGANTAQRQARVGEIASVYQPIMRAVVVNAMRRYRGNAYEQADVEDIAGHEVLSMLDPDREYFSTYIPSKGRLRHWIKTRIRNHAIDHLRKSRPQVELDEERTPLEAQIDQHINELEINEVFRLAIKLTAEHYAELGQAERFAIFKEVKSGQKRSPGIQSMSEWELRSLKSEVSSYIRKEALWQAALTVSDSPDDVYELVTAVWDKAKNRKSLDLEF